MKKCLYFILTLVFFACNDVQENVEEVKEHQVEETYVSFVGAETCEKCHKEEFKEWKGSHHEESMKVADSTTILGDFDDATFESGKVKATFFKKQGIYFVNTEGPEGEYEDFKISYTFGVFPLQQYLIDFPNGKKQCLMIAWDSKKGEWFSLYQDNNVHHTEWLHWTGVSMNWNTMCADCHSTDLHKNLDVVTGGFSTTYKEINVACEACHGPGSQHVNYYQQVNKTGEPPRFYMENGMDSKEVVEKCARCHSRRSQLTSHFDFEGHFLDHYRPSLLVEGLYETDGQIKDEVYVYGSFAQSKMYHNGVSCNDCHNVHSLKLKEEENELCLQCHDPSYNSTSHHFHEEGSASSLCVNCHMPGKLYMGNDFRRDHSFRVPRPDLSLKYDTPNACENCHSNEGAKWASDAISERYGDVRKDHFSDHLLPGYKGDQEELYALMSSSQYPEIVRATALLYYTRNVAFEDLNTVVAFLQDTSVLVKNEAIKSLESKGSKDFDDLISFLLNDDSRLIRISAAEYIVNLGHKNMSGKAFEEHLQRLQLQSDFAVGQLNLGNFYLNTGREQEAIVAYQKALEMDNQLNQARLNLALIYYNSSQVKKAENLYKVVVKQEPENAYAYYVLGLLYHELGKTELAKSNMKLACEQEVSEYRAFYNYALILQQELSFERSNEVVKKGLVTYERDEQLLYLKLLNEIKLNKLKVALKTCQILIEVNPDNLNYKQILAAIEQKSER